MQISLNFFPASLRCALACAKLAAVSAFAFAITPGYTYANADEKPPANETPWRTPTTEHIEASIVEWLVQSAATEKDANDRETTARPALNRLFADGDRLDSMMEALAAASPAIARLTVVCQESPTEAGTLEWLDSADSPYWLRSNVRLYVGRSLVRHHYYEQALEVLEGIGVEEVYDPASLLFYRSIAEHQLVRIEDAKLSLKALLDADEPLPERYAQVARLMQADIARVEEDSLDHIARRMSDVHRRLNLGEANDRAQEVERGILASLDKVIERLEEQQRQQQQQQQQASGPPSGQPMEDSQNIEMKGDGKVDIKEIGDKAGWGNLPPRERERVLQQIGRDFPGHYRDLMEEYLKRLATDEREEQQP